MHPPDMGESRGAEQALRIFDAGGRVALARRAWRKPLTTSVEEFATARGCEMAIACDQPMAATAALFAVAEIKWNSAAGGGRALWPVRAARRSVAADIRLTCEPAYEPGGVSRQANWGASDVPGGAAGAWQIGEQARLACSPPRLLDAGAEDLGETEARVKLGQADTDGWRAKELVEGLRAFAEKSSARSTQR